MKNWIVNVLAAGVLILCSLPSQAQGIGGELGKMQDVLDNLYTEMMPSCKDLIDVGRGIAGFAALFYIASRVWRHLANAEPVDFYPLFRPFVLGFCITCFPLVLELINGLMQPTVTATQAMVKGNDESIKVMLALKEKAVKGSEAYKMYVGEDGKGDVDLYAKYAFDVKEGEELTLTQKLFKPDIAFYYAATAYKMKNTVKMYLSEILMILYQAAALAINALRTFQMVILSILGPLVFGLAVFDGLQHTLTAWIARYLNVFLWLPVCNIFGAILGKLQIGMLKLDMAQITGGAQAGDTYFSAADAGYLIFLIIGILGYLTVPTVAGYIVNAGGAGALTSKSTMLMSAVSSGSMAYAGAAAGSVGSAVGNVARSGADKAGDFLSGKLQGSAAKDSSGSGSSSPGQGGLHVAHLNPKKTNS